MLHGTTMVRLLIQITEELHSRMFYKQNALAWYNLSMAFMYSVIFFFFISFHLISGKTGLLNLSSSIWVCQFYLSWIIQDDCLTCTTFFVILLLFLNQVFSMLNWGFTVSYFHYCSVSNLVFTMFCPNFYSN